MDRPNIIIMNTPPQLAGFIQRHSLNPMEQGITLEVYVDKILEQARQYILNPDEDQFNDDFIQRLAVDFDIGEYHESNSEVWYDFHNTTSSLLRTFVDILSEYDLVDKSVYTTFVNNNRIELEILYGRK